MENTNKDQNPNVEFKHMDVLQPIKAGLSTFNQDLPSPNVRTELMLTNQSMLRTLLSQVWLQKPATTILKTYADDTILYEFMFSNRRTGGIDSIHIDSPNMKTKIYDILSQYYLQVKFDVRVTIQVEGFMQTQGLLVLTKTPATRGHIRRIVKSYAALNKLVYMRWPKYLIPTMTPSSTSVDMTWNQPFNSFPIRITNASDPYSLNNVIDNGTLYLMLASAIQTADNVSILPTFQVFMSLVNLEFGPYQVS